jgi:hypothetical protein
MYRLVPTELTALSLFAERPHQHFELEPTLRPRLSRLWTSKLIRLRQGDIWQITEKGQALLDCGGRIH